MDISEAAKIKNTGTLKRHPWEIARRDVIKHFLIAQKAFPFAHIADIGTGDGFILQSLLEQNAARHFSAVDPFFNEGIVNQIKISSGAKNVQFYNKISEIPGDYSSFDCVLLLDVLEHVADDEGLIAEIRRHASRKNEATWIITVPAFQSLFSNHDRLLKHYRRYNLDQLVNLSKKCGLVIDQKGYFFFSLIPLRIIQKILAAFSKKEKATTIENWQGSKTLSAVLRKTLWIDFRIGLFLSNFRIYIPGLSCYCICH